MKKLLSIVFLAVALCMAAPFKEFSANNGFGEWKALRNCKAERVDGVLRLSDIKYDSSIVIEPVEYDPAAFNMVRITYVAKGIPATTRGQIFFRNDRKGAFGAHGYIHLTTLIGDGKEHVLNASIRDLGDATDWNDGGTIRSLRIDLMDEAGGTIDILSIVLDNDVSLKYPAAIEDEPDWPNVKPDFTGGVIVKGEPYFVGRVLCHPKENPRRAEPKTVWQLRKSFMVSGEVKSALVQAMGDDGVKVYLNGTQIVSNNDWRTTAYADVAASLFRQGENVIAIEYFNARSAGGALVELFYETADGEQHRIGSDASFKAASNVTDSAWREPGFKDVNWSTPLDYPPPPAGPWRGQLRYIDGALDGSLAGGAKSISVEAGATVPVELLFNGTVLPKCLPLDIDFKDAGGVSRWHEHFVVPTRDIVRIDGSNWKAVLRWKAPSFLDDGKYSISILPTTLRGDAVHTVAVEYKAAPLSNQKDAYGVMKTASGAQFHKNGKPFFMVCGNVCKYFNLPVHFSNAAQNVRVAYNDGWWLDEGSYDFGKFDYMAEALYRSDPDALLLIDINLDLPKSFNDKYKDEITRDGKRLLTGGRIEYSFASKPMRERIKVALEAALRHCEASRYSNRILGYRITGGDTTEWLSWPWSKDSLPDYSAPAAKAFREYIAKQYPQLPTDTPIPSEAERMADDGEALLKDVEKHLPALAYHDFFNFMHAECAAEMCKHARKVLGNNRAIGTYYGYTAHITAGYFPVMRGHYALEWFLENTKGAVNFIMSPQSYRIRRIGQNSVDMKPFQTLEEYGVIPIIEDDTRTHSAISWERFYDSQCQAVNAEQTVQICSRNMGIYIARLQPLMLYSLCSGADFDVPELIPYINSSLAAGQFAVEKGVGRHAEIAVVFSEKSPKYVAPNYNANARSRYTQWYAPDGTVKKFLGDGGFSILGESTTTQLLACSQIGGPVDYILAEDLHNHLGDYKLYIFTDCYEYDDAFLAAIQQLHKRKCTLLWIYAPGLYYKGKADVANMKRLTGIEFKRVPEPIVPAISMGKDFLGLTTLRLSPMFHVGKESGAEVIANYIGSDFGGLAATQCGEARSVFSGAYRLNVDFLKTLAKESGVRIYSDTNDPMEANDAFVTLHARSAGKKTITFPKPCDVLNVFTGDIVARDVTSYTFDAPLHSSWLFYYGKDADALRKAILTY